MDGFADFVGSVPYRETQLPWGDAHVWDLGEGRPIVLLHGIAGSRRIFFRVAPLLAKTRRVLVPPLRGEDIGAPRASWSDLLDDLKTLLESLDLREATLLGVSFGGTLALAYAARRDPRVREVIVQGAFPRFRLRFADRMVLALSRLVPPGLGARYFGWRVGRGAECRLLAEHAPGLDVLLADWSSKTPFSTLRRRVQLITGLDLESDLAGIDVPLTLARGGRDKVVPRFFFEELCRLRPDARTIEWPDAGHMPVLTHPDLVATLVA